MNIAPGDKIWYGDGHEGWVVDKNIVYRTYLLQTDQLADCLKDWFFRRKMKPCYGKCNRCVWHRNGGCSEWNGLGAIE